MKTRRCWTISGFWRSVPFAHRAGDNERESVLVRQFLERQPMLLEPSRAFDVRLLRYQERLKPLYWEGKRHTGVSGWPDRVRIMV